MVEDSTQEWFLEVEGNRTGPFTTEQVLGLLADGEILDTQRIAANLPDSPWYAVRDLEKLFAAKPTSTAGENTRSFVPPPRPADLPVSAQDTASMVASPGPQAEYGLIDVLLAAKERKAHATRALPPEKLAARIPFFRMLTQIPRNAWLLVGTAAMLCFATWGMVAFIKQKAPNPRSLSADARPATSSSSFSSVGTTTAAISEMRPATDAGAGSAGGPGTGTMRPGAPPPALNPATMMPTSLNQHVDREPEHDERDREREIASDASRGYQPPPSGSPAMDSNPYAPMAVLPDGLPANTASLPPGVEGTALNPPPPTQAVE